MNECDKPIGERTMTELVVVLSSVKAEEPPYICPLMVASSVF